MASSLIPTTPSPTTTTTTTNNNQSRGSQVHNNKKKKKPHSKNHHHQNQQSQIKWKSQTQQNLYSTKLRQALAGSRTACCGRGKAVRETADRVLATAARGRTRWSRAILTNRLKIKFRKNNHNNKRQRVVSPSIPIGPVRSRKTRFSVLRLKGKTVPAVQKKTRVLGRLVPGCRKEPLPVILEEAIDYIPALEMQVRAMAALADLLLGSSSSSSARAPPS